MTGVRDAIRRRPIVTYYLMVFAISWGGLFALALRTGFPATSSAMTALFPVALVFLFAGPSLAGPVLTVLIAGRPGLRDLRGRLTRWRVSPGWYGLALLTVPLLTTSVLVSLSALSPSFLPALFTSADKVGLVLLGVSIGMVGGTLEELGWTGFAVPQLRRQQSLLSTGLIVGVLWGVWHVPITVWGPNTWSSLIGPLFFYAAVLPAYRVLMVWLYDRTQSLFVAMTMHWTLSASTLFVLAPAVSGTSLVIYYAILAVPLWVLGIAVARRGRPTSARRRAPSMMSAETP